MRSFWVCLSAVSVAGLVLSASIPAIAAGSVATKNAGEQLNKRTKPSAKADNQGKNHGLSDADVRVMASYAWSIMPSVARTPDGKPIKLDRSNPKKYFIPIKDARTVIRAAMRSAYAQICNLPKLERANYLTLMQGEENRGIWTAEQMQFINALHMFSLSYFTGDLRIKEVRKGGGKQVVGKGSAKEAAAEADNKGDSAFNPSKPVCTPEKKAAVIKAINAYVAAAKAAQPPVAKQVTPQSTGTN